MSDQNVQEVDFSTVQAQAPDLAKALTQLDVAITKLNDLQAEILPLQEKGLVVPNINQRIHANQQAIAVAMDNTHGLLHKYQENEAVIAVAGAAYNEGMAYIQGIVFGVHYGRVALKHEKPFQRLLAEAYHMLERQQNRLSGS